MWLLDCNLLWEHSSLSYIVRRSDFQAKILKYWKILLKISKDSCCFAKYIRMPMESLASDVFLKDMNFYRHEFFRITFICGSKNHKSHYNFSFRFSISIKIFLWIWIATYLEFSEIYNKETAWWGLYFITPQVAGAETIFVEFFGISGTNN